MNQAVLAYYRQLLKDNFPHSGELENPSIFAEAVGKEMIHCSDGNFMELYLQVSERRITDIKYLCICEPAANVAVEILCRLLKGKEIDEAAALTEKKISAVLGTTDREFQEKAAGILELLKEGISNYSSNEDSGPL